MYSFNCPPKHCYINENFNGGANRSEKYIVIAAQDLRNQYTLFISFDIFMESFLNLFTIELWFEFLKTILILLTICDIIFRLAKLIIDYLITAV